MKSAILAIESSCDETAVAVLDECGNLVCQQLESQIEIHRKYGGVVPEVASRSHFEVLDLLVAKVLAEPILKNYSLVKVAATRGPGLVGPLIVGASYADGLAAGWGIESVGVHHLRGHLASTLLSADGTSGESLTQQAARVFPALVLLVSGGHTQVLRVDEKLRAEKLAETADDAAGECFDKSAKLMGLPYPGGPAIEALALQLAPADKPLAEEIYKKLPKPKSSEGFSFAGLKTAIRLRLEKEPALKQSPAFCWAIQEAIVESLCRGLERSFVAGTGLKHLVFCGGVSANQRLRARVGAWAARHCLSLVVPPLKYCTDNAAMIAAAAWLQDEALNLNEIKARIPIELGGPQSPVARSVQ